MKRDDLRILAGISTTNNAAGRESITEVKHAAVEKDGNFDIAVENESSVGRIAVALAKENLPVDITYAMDVFYFNFKSSKLKDQAEKIASSYMNVKEELQLDEGWMKADGKRFYFSLDASDPEEIEASLWVPITDKKEAEEFANSAEVVKAINALKMMQNKDLSAEDFIIRDENTSEHEEKGVKGWMFHLAI